MTMERCEILVTGKPASGPALVLGGPISFWGGIDPQTGVVVDPRHPNHGANIAGTVLFIPATIGSSTASTVLMELVHGGNAPAAIVMHEPDAILLVGLIVAAEMKWPVPPALQLDRARHQAFNGQQVAVEDSGVIRSV